ncbi:MAG: hypothetical protein WEB06_18945 [Actinomycetota bacterium]
MNRRSMLVAAAMVTLAAMAIPSAEASFPGLNGKLLFMSSRDGNSEIYVMSADGSGAANLTRNTAYDGEAAWSADGTKIAFSSFRAGNFEIYVMNADGTGVKRLTRNSWSDRDPAWSPDGKKIVFASARGKDPGTDLWVMNADGKKPIQLTQTFGMEHEPVWSPDGTWIAFRGTVGCCTSSEPPDLYVVRTDGSSRINVTNTPSVYESSPDWYPAPAISRLVFGACDGTCVGSGPIDWEIYTMDVPGSPVRLTFDTTPDGAPVWSPDGTRIVFGSSRDGDEEVYVMNADGTSVAPLTVNEVMDQRPDWQAI